jgi:hypothetical protein
MTRLVKTTHRKTHVGTIVHTADTLFSIVQGKIQSFGIIYVRYQHMYICI